MSEVFRQPVIVDGERVGVVGFRREDGRDFLRIHSKTNGQTVEFLVEDSEALIEMIRHALDTKSRPDESSTFGFQPFTPATEAAST